MWVRSDLTAVKFEVEKDEKTEMKDRKKGRNNEIRFIF